MYDCRHDVHPNRCSRHRYKLVSLYVYTTKIHFYVVNDRQIMQQCNKLSPENVVHFISFRFEKNQKWAKLHRCFTTLLRLKFRCGTFVFVSFSEEEKESP